MLPAGMSVRGSLRTMAVEDLLDWIDRRNLDGSLIVERAAIARSFVFKSGFITGVSSNQPSERVGQLLLRAGAMDQDTLATALEVQAETGGLLGSLLSSMGAVEDSQLRQVLEEQTREALLDSLLWSEGTFVFEPADQSPPEVDFPIALRLRACVVQGRQRALRWKRIRQVIPSDATELHIADRNLLSAGDDSEDELALILEYVAAIDQGSSVEQLVAFYHGRRFVVLDRLTRLIERGGVALGKAAAGRPAPVTPGLPPGTDQIPADQLEQAARHLAAAGDSHAALDIARQALQLEPHNPSIQNLFQEIERTVFAALSRDLLTSFRVPRLLVGMGELDRLGLNDTERYLVGRIDGHWDLLSLLRVTPVREAEALITFKRLADRGIISLK
jgi:hypothetical protein